MTTAEWLRTNNFKALPVVFVNGMVPYGYGDPRETPIVSFLARSRRRPLTFNSSTCFSTLPPRCWLPLLASSRATSSVCEIHVNSCTRLTAADFHKVFVNFAKSSITGPIRLGTTITSIGNRPVPVQPGAC